MTINHSFKSLQRIVIPVILIVFGTEVQSVFPSDQKLSTKETVLRELPSCSQLPKLPTQPVFVNATFNVIRKCCKPGESFLASEGDTNHAAQCGADEPWGPFEVQAISGQFYKGCIEDLELDPPPALGMEYGNPCYIEGGLVKFGPESKDTLYVLQNGSLLVINELADEYDIYNGYCLDVDRSNGSLNAYVCPSQLRFTKNVFKGQMMALALCLIFAIPLLLATAYLYVAIPKFNDIHGKALSLNCINFAIALLLESIFQHKTRGSGSTDDTVELANYAEYFILATFFWLLVNCMNNCIHAWYFLPKGVSIRMGGEKRTFALYTSFAQLIPLAIILLSSSNRDPTALKHYFFIPIIVIIVLNIVSFFVTFWGFQRVSDIQIRTYSIRGRLSLPNNNSDEANAAALASLPQIRTRDVEKVKYMAKYTAMLFIVMAGVWSTTIATYYSIHMIPILFDILFGLQGILIFLIFICLPRPFRTVKAWFQQKGYCGCRVDPDSEADLRRNGSQREGENGRESAPLNKVTTT